MRLTTQWRATFRVKSFKAAVIKGRWGVLWRREDGGRGIEVAGGTATPQEPHEYNAHFIYRSHHRFMPIDNKGLTY